ncbi:MAG: sugar ABC transporter permease [Eubacteriales bacterium]|nr:sugar ABC transporter permease [Eubacteriales bacterium]
MKITDKWSAPAGRLRGAGTKINRLLRQNAAGERQESGFSGAGGEKPRRRGKRTQKERRENRVSWTFLSLSVAGVALFFVIPFFVVIYYSMIDNPVRHNFVGITNYVKVFNNSAFRLAALNTLKFSVTAVPLAVGLALLLAVEMEKRLPWKSRFRSFFLSPMMVPTASVIMIWQILFHYNGLVNVFIKHFGGGKIDWLKSGYAQIPIILLFLWKNIGYNMILFMAGLANIPRDQIEVARLESATEFQIFWMIKIRYLSSTILFVTIMSLINSFKIFREVYLMAGDYPYDALYMLQHFMNNTFRSLDYQKLSAAAVIMAIFMVFVIGALFVMEDRFSRDLE